MTLVSPKTNPFAFLLLPALFMLAVVFSSPSMAQADDGRLMAMVQDLQAQMSKMQGTINDQNNKIRQLERQPSVSVAPSNGEAAAPMSDYEFNTRLDAATGGAQKWLKDLSFKGDFRLRYEAFDFRTGAVANDDSRNRFRYRLRYGFEKKFNEDMKIGFAMASGESSAGVQTDPTSTNTTFDKLFNFKDIFIEKAFATYTPSWAKVGPVEKLTFTGGKMDNPFEKGSSDMIWDRDVKPEGAIEKIDLNLIDGEQLDMKGYFTAGQFVLDEDSATGGADASLFAYQIGMNPIMYTSFLERPVEWLSAVSFYNYRNYTRNSNFLIDNATLLSGASATNQRGNFNSTGLTTELDAARFRVLDFYNEFTLTPKGIPVRPFFDWAHNVADADLIEGEKDAWALGLKVGGIVKKGDWEVGYTYKRIPTGSVVGAFNDSDFGLGHSAKVGSVFKAGYALTDNITLNSAAFFVENLNTGNPVFIDEQQRRFQVDLNWKF